MLIDPSRCVACGNCVSVCPMGAIYIDPTARRAAVNADECVECYTCYRGMSMERLPPRLIRAVRRTLAVFRLRFDPEPDVCPTSAIVPDPLTWPRTVRRAFSDVTAPHESTGVHGRGTEEVKTNDVTGRLDVGRVGCTVELGRPGIGVWFRDVQTVTSALAGAGVVFERKNPVTSLMTNAETGTINSAVLDEKVMSVIIEFTVDEAHLARTLALLRDRAATLPTVMAVGVSARCDDRGATEVEAILAAQGYHPARAKTNLGLASRAALPVASSASESS